MPKFLKICAFVKAIWKQSKTAITTIFPNILTALALSALMPTIWAWTVTTLSKCIKTKLRPISEKIIRILLWSRKLKQPFPIVNIAVYAAWSAYNQFILTPATEAPAEETIVVDDANVDFPLKVEDYSTNVETQATEENASEDAKEAEKESLPIVDVTSAENTQQVTMTDKSFVEPAAEKTTQAESKTIENAKNAEETQEQSVVEQEKAAKPAKSGVTVNVLKETWIEVKNEKTLYISKVLQAGDSYTLPKASNLKLSVGKADGVEIMYNGKKAYEIAPNKKMNISVDEIIAGAQD